MNPDKRDSDHTDSSGQNGHRSGNSGQASGNSGQASGNSGQHSGNSGQNSGNSGQNSGNSAQRPGDNGRGSGQSGLNSGGASSRWGLRKKNRRNTGDEEDAGQRRQKLLDRFRTRIDRYRELGKARRERLEGRIRQRQERPTGGAEGPAVFDVVPGTARPMLSAQDFGELEKLIGYTIKHRAYFLQAVTHRSYLQFVQLPTLRSNERLEFLGDSILNLVIAEYLYSEFETQPEGELTKLRSRLVSGAALVHHAMDIELERFLLLSTSADTALKRGSATLLADAYEAIIAAIYLDGGMDAARDFIYHHIITHTRRDELMLSDKNYKSMLLEFVQSKKMSSPRYVTVHEEGPNHARTFSVDVMVNGHRNGTGTGKSKKEAEQNAAREALETLGVLPPTHRNGEESKDV